MKDPAFVRRVSIELSKCGIRRLPLSLAKPAAFHYYKSMKRKGKGVPLTLLQMDTSKDGGGCVDRVLHTLGSIVRKKGGIVLLPEIWSGDFAWPEIEATAHKTPAILKELCRISRDHSSLIVGSLPERRGEHLLNTAFLVEDGRVLGRYVKQYLFSPMEEDRYFSTRRSRKVFDTKYGKIGVAICFDLRFPESFRTFHRSGGWLILVPAQWPKPRCAHWETLLVARAIENQAFVAGCNRVGKTGRTSFCGGSMIVDPWGKVLARGKGRHGMVSAVVHPGRTDEVRKSIPMNGIG
ncbi:MAG: carbon-nitrogen family hydrolase [Deltaproteobacteria bacterium]|nr:carbon-nitrogen family hydrolase [Deltaproteobacteria bacterium]